MNNFKWAIMGTGGIAQAFAEDLQRLQGHTVAAVGSRNIETASAFAQKYSGAMAFGSYEELVRADVDAVYIATPHTFHCDNMKLALNAGKPVLCEKAFTINARQAAEVISLAKTKNLYLQEALWSRFLPHMHRLKEIVASGALGQIHSIFADHGQYLTQNPNPRLWDPALGGGALLDVGIYPIQFAHLFLGVPDSIIASAVLSEKGVDLQNSITFNYNSGAQAVLASSLVNRTPITAAIVGDKARIEIDGFFFAPTSFRVLANDGTVLDIYINEYQGIGLREEAEVFARNVLSGKLESVEHPLSASLELMEIMDEVRKIIGVTYPEEN